MKYKYLLSVLIFMLGFVPSAHSVWVVTEDSTEFNDSGERLTTRSIHVHFGRSKPKTENNATAEKTDPASLTSTINAKIISNDFDKLSRIWFHGINTNNIDNLKSTIEGLTNTTKNMDIRAFNVKDDKILQYDLNDLVKKALKTLH